MIKLVMSITIVLLIILFLTTMIIFYILANVEEYKNRKFNENDQKWINIGRIITFISLISCFVISRIKWDEDRFLSSGFIAMAVIEVVVFLGFALLGAN